MSETLVARLLSGKPTPLEREAAQAIMQEQKDAARYRFIQLEDNHAAVEAVNHFFGRELDAAIDAAMESYTHPTGGDT